MFSISPEQERLNAEKSLALASALFPLEEWIPHGKGIFVAKNRLIGGHKEQAKLYREISDVRILTGRGSVAYFLPERFDGDKTARNEVIHNMHADTVIDGVVVEIKTVSSNRTTLGKSFRRAIVGNEIKNPALSGQVVAEEAISDFRPLPPPQVAS
jgi:hypothetical protein